jgi:RNA polymerase sigma-70 factor, ECF subfamily
MSGGISIASSAMSSTDEAIVARLLSRDESALREVMAAHGPAVFAMAKRVVADPAGAEEVAQDTFVALWRRPGSFDPSRGSLRTFLLGVVRNKSVDLIRKEESMRRRTQDLLAQTTEEDAVVALDAADDRSVLTQALGSLGAGQREAILLAYFGGFTYREVAEQLDIPEGTAKSRLRDGLIKMREVLGPRGAS